MPKEKFKYRGKTPEELKKMSREKVAELLPARQRRTIKRGLREEHEKLMKKIKENDGEDLIKTHQRDLIILPEIFGKKIKVHNGNEWKTIEIKPEMIGHYLGEFALTRPEKVKHSGPGIGATRGTKFLSVK